MKYTSNTINFMEQISQTINTLKLAEIQSLFFFKVT